MPDRAETPSAAEARVLEEATFHGATKPPRHPRTLSTEKVEVELGVFQHRTVNSLDHAEELAKAMRADPQGHWPPVLIWWSGRRWLVVDGHHRLKAYRMVNQRRRKPLLVPVKVFDGDLDEAQAQALAENNKNHLSMRSTEKANAAWRLLCKGEMRVPRWTIPELMRFTGWSKGTISNARAIYRKLVEAGEPPRELGGYSWERVRALAAGDTKNAEWSEEAEQRVVIEKAEAVRRQLRDMPKKNPELFLKIIMEAYPETARQMLSTETGWELRDEVEEYEAEQKETADDYKGDHEEDPF